jgi:heme A synthase
LTESDKRLVATVVVLAILGVLQLVTGLPIGAWMAFAGAAVLVLIFLASRRR